MFSLIKKLLGERSSDVPAEPNDDVPSADVRAEDSTVAPLPIPKKVERSGLDYFITDFLQPIATDGALDPRIEETPLIVAFHVYGLAEWHRRDAEALRQTLCDATAAGMRAPSTRSEPKLLNAWERIRTHSARMTSTQYRGLREWFSNEAARLGYSTEFHDPEAMPEFSLEPLSDECLQLFRQLFRQISDELRPAELPDTDSTTPEPEPPPIANQMITPPPPIPPVAPPPAPPVPAVDIIEVSACPDVIAAMVDGSLVSQLRAEADEIVSDIERRLEGDDLLGLAFDECRADRMERALIVPELAEEADLWFVGDVHGDLLGLSCALDYIDRTAADRDPTIVLLGDLFDDGGFSYETLLFVYQRILRAASRVCVIAGNHDDALAIDGDAFHSSVWPSNFTEWLNTTEDETARRAGRAAVRFFAQAPRALFLPDGLIVAHGGVPHSDLQERLQAPADLNLEECLQDFVWTRLHDRAKRRIPNRTSRGCELGRENFEAFCDKATELLDRPVRRMVRGHDHIDRRERFAVWPLYERNPVLTINNMSNRLPREVFGPYVHVPCVGRWTRDALPEVHQIVIPEEAILQVYPVPAE